MVLDTARTGKILSNTPPPTARETKRQEGDVKESSSKIQEPLSSINSLSKEERDKRKEQRAFVRQQHVDLPSKQQVQQKGKRSVYTFLLSFNAFPYTYVVYGTVVNRILCWQ